MALTIGESIAVQRVTDWLTSLTLHERTPTEGTLPGEEDRDLIGALTLLADSARKTLAAGPTGADVAEQLRRALDIEP